MATNPIFFVIIIFVYKQINLWEDPYICRLTRLKFVVCIQSKYNGHEHLRWGIVKPSMTMTFEPLQTVGVDFHLSAWICYHDFNQFYWLVKFSEVQVQDLFKNWNTAKVPNSWNLLFLDSTKGMLFVANTRRKPELSVLSLIVCPINCPLNY